MEGQPQLVTQANRILERIRSLRTPIAKLHPTATDVFFVPRHVLRKELSVGNIRTLLDYYGIIGVSCDTVHQDYLAVLGTLIAINQTKYIACFTQYLEFADDRLPFHDPSEWSPECCVFFEDFKSAQWAFCAQEFRAGRLGDKRLNPNRILPIIERRCLNRGPDSIVEEIDVHPDYNCLGVEKTVTSASINKFVLKSYDTKYEALYRNEIAAYRLLQHFDVANNVVRMYGSWTQDRTHSILLELVDGGTLADLFQSPHPTSSQDRLVFWTNLIRILEPLGSIHQHSDPNDSKCLIEGVHQDIKLANILVAKANAGSLFDFTFKLVDMGLVSFDRTAAHKGKYRKKDGRGSQPYSPPECFRDERDAYDERSPSEVHPSKDIWSLGCVFSFALVWSVLGPIKLKEYQQSLVDATAQVSRIRDTAYMGCFHDGEKALEEVNLMHIEVLKACGKSDQIINDMVPIITAMLDEVIEDRPSAKKVRKSCLSALQRARELSAPVVSQIPVAFRTRKEIMSQPQPSLEIRHATNGHGLGIDVPDSPQTPMTQSTRDLESDTQDLPVADLRLSYIHRKNPSIDAVMSSPSPTYRSYDTPNGLIKAGIEPSHGWLSETPVPLRTNSGEVQRQRSVIDRHQKSSAFMANGLSSPPEGNVTLAGPANGLAGRSKKMNHGLPQAAQAHHQKTERFATIDEVSIQIQRKKNKVPTTSTFEDLLSLNSLRNRDQIFLIDNSKSMQEHWAHVRKTFEVLGYVVKHADPDGMELFFTNWTKSDRQKDREKLLRLFDCVKTCGQGGMEITLSKILDKCTRKRPLASIIGPGKDRGVNIYILTDGIWNGEDDSLCGIPEAIKQTVARMNTRYSIGIQFIQFGNNPYGSHRLKRLDDGLEEKNIMDIIDHTHMDGNVFKMLLGSTDTYWDDQPSKTSSRLSAQALPVDLKKTGAWRYT